MRGLSWTGLRCSIKSHDICLLQSGQRLFCTGPRRPGTVSTPSLIDMDEFHLSRDQAKNILDVEHKDGVLTLLVEDVRWLCSRCPLGEIKIRTASHDLLGLCAELIISLKRTLLNTDQWPPPAATPCAGVVDTCMPLSFCLWCFMSQSLALNCHLTCPIRSVYGKGAPTQYFGCMLLEHSITCLLELAPAEWMQNCLSSRT